MSEKELNDFIAKKIKHYLEVQNKTQLDLAEYMNVSQATISNWCKGVKIPRMNKIDKIAEFFNIKRSDLMVDKEETNVTPIQLGDSISIPVFGSVPAGVPIEAIQDINEYIDIPKSWTTGGKEYFALTVKGDSMYPKYLEGDVVVVRVEEDCESGQDCVVYVNGYDATLKKVIKRDDYLILQPLNLEYEPRMFDLRDGATPPVKIAGVVVEIRRRV